MAKTNLRLEIETSNNRELTNTQLSMISKALNNWFQDASFTLEFFDQPISADNMPVDLNNWEASAMAQLLKSEKPVRLLKKKNDKVRVHRLKAKLPDGVKIKNKREGKYQLVQL